MKCNDCGSEIEFLVTVITPDTTYNCIDDYYVNVKKNLYQCPNCKQIIVKGY